MLGDNEILVSVVIPLYNKGFHIKRALESVLNQTIQEIEIIVIDGNSTDNGPQIVKNCNDPRVQFFVQEGVGVSKARNQGVEYAHSNFIAFLDADDEWEPDHLESLLRLYNKFPEAGLYSTAYLYCFSANQKKIAHFYAVPEAPWEGILPNYFKSAAYGAPPVWTSVVGIPKNVYKIMNGFNTSISRGEDADLWVRIALKYSIAFSWNGIGIYNLDSSNRTCNKVEPAKEHIFIKNALDAIENNEVSSEDRKYIYKYISKKQLERAILNVKAGRFDLVVNISIDGIIHKYFNLTDFWILSKVIVKFVLSRSQVNRTK